MGKIYKYIYDSVVIKNLPANARDARHVGSTPRSGRSPEIGISQYSCLEKSHGQRSLAGYPLRGHKEWHKTEEVSTHTHTYIDCVINS